MSAATQNRRNPLRRHLSSQLLLPQQPVGSSSSSQQAASFSPQDGFSDKIGREVVHEFGQMHLLQSAEPVIEPTLGSADATIPAAKQSLPEATRGRLATVTVRIDQATDGQLGGGGSNSSVAKEGADATANGHGHALSPHDAVVVPTPPPSRSPRSRQKALVLNHALTRAELDARERRQDILRASLEERDAALERQERASEAANRARTAELETFKASLKAREVALASAETELYTAAEEAYDPSSYEHTRQHLVHKQQEVDDARENVRAELEASAGDLVDRIRKLEGLIGRQNANIAKLRAANAGLRERLAKVVAKTSSSPGRVVYLEGRYHVY